MGEQSKKLGVMMLAALVVSAMVGGGIFSLPQNMSQGAGAGAVLIAWIITGVGIFFLANTFRILADARPDATDRALKEKPSFTPMEAMCAIAMVIVAIIAVVLAATGKIKF